MSSLFRSTPQPRNERKVIRQEPMSHACAFWSGLDLPHHGAKNLMKCTLPSFTWVNQPYTNMGVNAKREHDNELRDFLSSPSSHREC